MQVGLLEISNKSKRILNNIPGTNEDWLFGTEPVFRKDVHPAILHLLLIDRSEIITQVFPEVN